MKTIDFSDLDSLYKWMIFIVNTKEAMLKKSNCQLNIFGEDDVYLVINKYENESSAIDYLFQPDDGLNSLSVLFSFLEKFNFSIEKLIKELPSWVFIDGDIKDYIVFGNMRVFKEYVTSNQEEMMQRQATI
jgi:hypothetical protein